MSRRSDPMAEAAPDDESDFHSLKEDLEHIRDTEKPSLRILDYVKRFIR